MIKPLYFYKRDKHNIICNIFDDDVEIECSDIDVDAIMEDFKELTIKLGIADDIYLDGNFDWQEETDLIDLQLDIEEQYKDSWGCFYITWYRGEWECDHIWYNGDIDGEAKTDWKNT